MSTHREQKIRAVIEDDRYSDDAARVREIARLCGDDRIHDFTDRKLSDVRDGFTNARRAARAIDDEQEYWDRRDRERERNQ